MTTLRWGWLVLLLEGTLRMLLAKRVETVYRDDLECMKGGFFSEMASSQGAALLCFSGERRANGGR